MKTYLLIDENSPELAIECGSFEVKGLYAHKGQALAELEQRIDVEKEFDYLCIERIETGTETCLTFYKNGDENSPLWFNVKLIELEGK